MYMNFDIASVGRISNHLGYAAKVGEFASDKESLERPDASSILLDSWSLPLKVLDMDALQILRCLSA